MQRSIYIDGRRDAFPKKGDNYIYYIHSCHT